MADNRPLSENEADYRLKAALNALGEAPGITVAADMREANDYDP